MSMYYGEQLAMDTGAGAQSRPASTVACSPTAKWASSILLISILIGVIGREWTWLQSMSGALYGPIIGLGAIGILCAGIMVGAFSSAGKRFLLIGWFFAAVITKQFYHTPYDMPLDVEAWHVLVAYAVAAIAGLAGLHMGMDSASARWFLTRSARIFAVISIVAFVCGAPPAGTHLVFPSMYVGFPMRLFVLFPFCWYLDKWLQGGWISKSLIGLAASSLSVIVVFHKPIVFSGAVAALAIAFLQVRRGNFVRSLARFAILGGICIAGFIVVDTMQDGRLSDQYLDSVYKNFFHRDRATFNAMNADEIWEAWSGGRFKLWDTAMVRFDASPIFGTGVGQRIWTSSGIIPLHNQYLDFLLSVGIFGSIPVVLTGVLWAKAALRRSRGPDADWVVPVVAFAVGIGAYGIGGTPNQFPFLCALLFFCMGMVAAPVSSYTGYRERGNIG